MPALEELPRPCRRKGDAVLIRLDLAGDPDLHGGATISACSGLGSELDGQGPEAWQKFCGDGSVKGYALVNGDTDFPGDFTSETGRIPDKFNCTGGAVEAKRVGVGNYRGRFGGSPAAIAVANSYGPGSFDEYVSVNHEAATGEWEVVIHNSNGQPTDHHFTIVIM